MHILLTDLLACPRCGPAFGLIVLADEMEGRVVVEGRLGCMNCREEYPVRGGVADLRVAGEAAPDSAADAMEADSPAPAAGEPGIGDRAGGPASPDGGMQDPAYRVAALLGVGHGPGAVLVVGGSADDVARIDELLPNAQVVGGTAAESAPAGRGWIRLGPRLPFRDRTLRGVALLGAAGAAEDVLTEALRTLAPGARLVLDPARPGTGDLLEESGVTVLLDQDGVVVASTPTGR